MMKTFAEIIFLLYFVSHIFITVLFDSHVVLPKWVYPTALCELMVTYSKSFKDPFVLDPPAWFKSFVYCELLFQLPFFFVATFAFWKGGCRWIRVPAIIYGSHVATTLIPILFEIMTADFSADSHHVEPAAAAAAAAVAAGPVTMSERLALAAVYAPYLVVPLILVYHMLTSEQYVSSRPSKNPLKQQ